MSETIEEMGIRMRASGNVPYDVKQECVSDGNVWLHGRRAQAQVAMRDAEGSNYHGNRLNFLEGIFKAGEWVMSGFWDLDRKNIHTKVMEPGLIRLESADGNGQVQYFNKDGEVRSDGSPLYPPRESDLMKFIDFLANHPKVTVFSSLVIGTIVAASLMLPSKEVIEANLGVNTLPDQPKIERMATLTPEYKATRLPTLTPIHKPTRLPTYTPIPKK